MKNKPFVIAFIICLILLLIFIFPHSNTLPTGAIYFQEMDSKKEAFRIKTQMVIPPNSHIIFTDTEWNGTRFGVDEHTLIWNSGKDSIPKKCVIYFKNLKSHPIVSIGELKGFLKIASKNEAIFAYQGTNRMPTHFIAGIAYSISDYGTLVNTGLIIDSTAVLMPFKNDTN